MCSWLQHLRYRKWEKILRSVCSLADKDQSVGRRRPPGPPRPCHRYPSQVSSSFPVPFSLLPGVCCSAHAGIFLRRPAAPPTPTEGPEHPQVITPARRLLAWLWPHLGVSLIRCGRNRLPAPLGAPSPGFSTHPGGGGPATSGTERCWHLPSQEQPQGSSSKAMRPELGRQGELYGSVDKEQSRCWAQPSRREGGGKGGRESQQLPPAPLGAEADSSGSGWGFSLLWELISSQAARRCSRAPCLEKWVLGTGTGNEDPAGTPAGGGGGSLCSWVPAPVPRLHVDPYEMWQGHFLSKLLWFV